ncbi:MAG: hypothetical protein U9R19_04645 [Bacteroidota bacterium]|nr:hypothetical protein [Bacteroidota bacterium]
MTRILFTFILLIAGFMASAQMQRQILLEHFTNASCGSCAFFNPGLQALVDANSPNIIVLRYQLAYPGYDPMNLHNPVEIANRTSYYSVGGVPNVIMDGNYYSGNLVNFTQTVIDNHINDLSLFSIDISHALSTGSDSVLVQVDIRSLHSVSGAFRAFLVVVEDEINFAIAPGTNGETQFKYVMKKFLPNEKGIEIPVNFISGQSISLNQAWAMQNVYDSSQIAVVAFVQDTITKEVYQTAYSQLLPQLSYDAALFLSENFEAEICGNSISPIFTIKNLGAIVLNSLNIEYQINNGTVQTFTWSGTLLGQQQEEIQLPIINFVPQFTNILNISGFFSSPVIDQNILNNNLSASLPMAGESSSLVYFELEPDSALTEISWQITNYNSDTLYFGGPYQNNSLLLITEYFDLPETACYTFSIFDSEGNGLSNGNGQGYYRLSDIFGDQLFFGSQFQNSKKHKVEIIDTIGSLPPWNYSASSIIHHILLSDSIELNLPGFSFGPGDFVGAFFQENGQWHCGGYTHFSSDNSVLICNGAGAGISGFTSGQEFEFRLWDASQSDFVEVEAVFNLLDFPNGSSFVQQGVSGITGFYFINSHTINLPQGWSLISTFINPIQTNIDSVTATIQSNVIIAKNGIGNVFWPQYGVNAIGNIIIGQAYQFNMNNPDTLIIYGSPVVPELETLMIPAGWSFLGYLRQSPASIVNILSPIVSEIKIVKNGIGLVYWPVWNVNAIGNMQPGRGYQINMNSAQNYFFPPN